MDNKLIRDKYIIIGLGATGVSVAKFLLKNNKQVILIDSNAKPGNLQDILKLDLKANDDLFLGLNKFELLDKVKDINPDEIVLSPGCVGYLLEDLALLNIPITSDIQLFIDYVTSNYNSKVIGITGTNGKSTVTALVYHLLKKSNHKVKLGGNYGIPVLDLLQEDNHKIDSDNIYVLELSSFQLEISNNLNSAVILNLAPDHLDRYNNLEDYYYAKYKIYSNAENIIINKDNKNLVNLSNQIIKNRLEFSYFDNNDDTGFYVKNDFIYYKDYQILDINKLSLFGIHNIYNALACIALVFSILDIKALDVKIKALQQIALNAYSFKGLEHRSEIFLDKNDITWINDSKGTNLDATSAALNSLVNLKYNKLWLILGGVLKEKDFVEFNKILKNIVDKNNLGGIVIFGKSKDEIYNNILSKDTKDFLIIENSKEVSNDKILGKIVSLVLDKHNKAVNENNLAVNLKDIVLFSPACASFDMFKNYMQRGSIFKEIVKENYNGTK